MGELVSTGLSAPVQLSRLAQTGVHVGMLVDQHYTKGVEVIFFGRRCMANPLIARLARQTECPIHGLRVIRNPDGNSFVAEITEPIAPARDAEGRSMRGHHAGYHVGGRRLGARVSRAMAVAASPLAVTVPSATRNRSSFSAYRIVYFGYLSALLTIARPVSRL